MIDRYRSSKNDLRDRLYARQRRLLGLKEGHEFVALPGDLVKANPALVHSFPSPRIRDRIALVLIVIADGLDPRGRHA